MLPSPLQSLLLSLDSGTGDPQSSLGLGNSVVSISCLLMCLFSYVLTVTGILPSDGFLFVDSVIEANEGLVAAAGCVADIVVTFLSLAFLAVGQEE